LEPIRVANCRNLVGESPVWHAEGGCVYWTDINGFRIQRLVPETGQLNYWCFTESVAAISLTTVEGWLLVALGSKLILWSPATDERLEFARPECDPRIRLNDGASDSNGVYWIGGMQNNVAADGAPFDITADLGSLYRVTSAREVTVWDSGYGITNSIAWSPDYNTLYCACSIQNVIYAYDYCLADSSLRKRRVFICGLQRGVPDGSAVDTEGYLWNCRFFGGCILRIAPNGTLDRIIEMPVSNVTHCAFGGPNLSTLYVTSASIGAPPSEKTAGDLFAIETSVRGMPIGRFRISGEAISKMSNAMYVSP